MTDALTGSFDEERLLEILRHCPAACAVTRWRDRRFVAINEAFTALLGWTREEIVGRTGADLRLVESEVAEQLRTNLSALLELRDQELAVRTREGELRQIVIASDLVQLRGERHLITMFVDVTARHQAAAVANRLAAIVESTDDAIVSKDLNGIVQTWNRGAERIFGYAADEMVGASITRIIPEDRTDEERFILLRIAQGLGITNLETKRRRKDGVIIDVSITTSPMRDATGTIVGVSKIARDITEYRRNENARRSSEARYRALFEESPDGILIGDRDYNFLDANPAYVRMLGYTHDELMQMRLSALVPPGEGARMDAALATIASHGVYRGDWRLFRKDGSSFDAEVIGARLPDGVMGIVRDVTEQKAGETRFRRLVDSNAQGVSFWRWTGEVTDANDAFLRIIGRTREDLDAGRVNWKKLTPPEHAVADARCLEELSARGVCTPYEKEYTRPDGSRVSVLVGAATLGEGPTEGVSFIVDLTQQKKLEQQFFRAQRMESVGTLAGGIAHDLNNVLAPILLSAGLLRGELKDSRQLALLETVQSCAQRGAELVQQVLSFARGVEGRHIVVSPVHVLRDALKVMRDTFPRSIDIGFDAPAEVWAVLGDPTQLHQVLLNLAVNARDAMPRGGKLELTMENMHVDETYASMHVGARPGRYVLVSVTDTGGGIAPELRDRIFEPFFTTKEVGKGTGLGLSTSAAIVKSHGGFVDFESEVGRGSTFKVFWPAAPSDAAQEEAAEASTVPRGNGELVLVVDDEDAVRRATRATLERFGYRAMLAANGAEGVAQFAVHRNEIAATITDMAMPVMDGPSMVVALKAIDPDAKIIATSGLATEHGVARVEQAGVRHFIPKPYTADVLLRTLSEVLHGLPAPDDTGA
jgi:PAS domain S-box-containing protein